MIGEGAVLEGSFAVERGLQVDGTLQGDRLSAGEALVVGRGGSVEAALIEVEEAVIGGSVVGALSARRKVRLKAGGRFRGVLRTPHLIIEEGAELEEDRSVEEKAGEKP